MGDTKVAYGTSHPLFADGLRTIAPLNQHRGDLNVAAVVQWALANSKQFPNILLHLKGVHGSSTATQPGFMSLYVQLLRAERWEGLSLL